jgi:predicted Zn-dependent protease
MDDDEVRRERHEHAALLVSRGQYQEAIWIYQALQADAANDLNVLAALRDLYTRLGRTAELADQWRLLAEVRAAAGRYPEARSAIERATSLDPDRGELHELSAELLIRHGGFGSQRAYLGAAARAYLKAGNDEALWRVLLRTEQVCGEPFAELRAYAERLERSPDDKAAAAGLDDVYRHLGWPTNLGDELGAKVQETLRTRGPLAAVRAQANVERLGGYLDAGLYRELAERCERIDGGRELADLMHRQAERVAGRKRSIH